MAAAPGRSGQASPPRAGGSPRFDGARSHGITFENTYLLKPQDYGDKNALFNRKAVSAVVLQKLINRLEGTVYDAEHAATWANELSTAIRDGVKATGLQRYKICVHVTVGQRDGQAMRVASRCLWDSSTDNFVSEEYENDSLFASAQVFALFTE